MVKNKISFIVLLILVFFTFFLVKKKQKAIMKKNNRPIISFYSQFEKNGKPVCIQKIKGTDLNTKIKTTISCIEKNKFYAHVSKNLFEKIKENSQVIFRVNNSYIAGAVKQLNPILDQNIGLYRIEGEFSTDVDILSSNYIADIVVEQKQNIITLPIESIEIEDEETFVWVVKDDKCFKRRVMIKSQKEDFYEIEEGLEKGEKVVVKGMKELNENDKVFVINLGEKE